MQADEQSSDERGIAIVGMAGRFPGAATIDAFWANLRDGVESIATLSDEQLRTAGVDERLLADPSYVKAAATIEGAEQFDAAFFGLTPKEAALLDPQQRLILECAWEALEHAGYDSSRYSGLVGVYAGAAWNTYLLNNLIGHRERLGADSGPQIFMANDKDFLPTRISYKLNLTGPSVTVQTACSTSLVAVHLACLSLLNYECDMALAGGVTLLVPQQVGYPYLPGGFDSPDGHCRVFDAEAAGTIFGSGVGLVALKRLGDALADGDSIYAVIKGSAINNDGSLKVGYTAPSVEGQAEVIAAAQAIAQVPAETIGYVEAHGTGTALGDPIEVAALTRAFRATTDRRGFCALGSAKSNIGHLSVAAGVTGLIKTALALTHRQIPPSLHFQRPNPKIDFDNSPFYVNTQLAGWPAGATPRRAAVSSFGIGGTNAHAILEEAPPLPESDQGRPYQLLLLSARTPTALDAAAERLGQHLGQQPEACLADVAYTLALGRRAFEQRRALVCRDQAGALEALGASLSSAPQAGRRASGLPAPAFLFSGQGSQYPGMSQQIYETEPFFREVVDRCCALLHPLIGQDLRAVLYPQPGQRAQSAEALRQTALAQPALFVVEYALAQLWMHWGVQPQAMLGHSIGEYVAATLAGVMGLEDALALVAARGRLIQRLPAGAMLSVQLPADELRPLLGPSLSLAAVNAPGWCVASGSFEAIAGLERQLSERGVSARRLHTSHAFHSSMLEPALEPFLQELRRVSLQPPQIPYLSNLTGTWISAAQATDPGYWVRHLRETVLFAPGVAALLAEPRRILLEIGPGRSLSGLARQQLSGGNAALALSSLPGADQQLDDWACLLEAAGALWSSGLNLDWSNFYAGQRRRRVALPSYPFERQRFWLEAGIPPAGPDAGAASQPLAGRQAPPDWFYLQSWQRSLPPAQPPTGSAGCWLVFGDQCGVSAELSRRLAQQGAALVQVQAAEAFCKLGPASYAIAPRSREDYERLLKDLAGQGLSPDRVLHAWSVTAESDAPLTPERAEQAQGLGFYSLLCLAQALGLEQRGVAITILSSGMQQVAGERELQPEKATLIGPCRVIPQEYPQLRCQSIDLPAEAGALRDRLLLDQLWRELLVEPVDAILAYRNRMRWVQRYEPARLELSADGGLLRERGVYLISGGLGGIGFALAQHLGRTLQARLVLIGRSGFPAPEEWAAWLEAHPQHDQVSQKILRLQELERAGAQVLVCRADVTRPAELRAVVQEARRRFGSIHGVVHAAGVPGGGIIQLKQQQQAAEVLAPKLQGTLALDAVLDDLELDFLILYSSLTAVIGGAGQVDYCAANAFLDAFACYKQLHASTRVLSINWDAWREVGMAARSALGGAAQPSSPRAGERALSHPLIEGYDQASGQTRFISRLSCARHWVLDEHRIMGVATLPGTAYLELAAAALRQSADVQGVQIDQLLFSAPLIAGDQAPQELQTLLEPDADGFRLRIVSQAAPATGEQQHVTGRLRGTSRQPARYQIEQISERCSRERHSVARGAQRMSGSFMHWGPHWSSLVEVHAGVDEWLGVLELPGEYAGELAEFQLHPAIMDVATNFAVPWIQEGNYVPMLYERVELLGPLAPRLYSYLRCRREQTTPELICCDITLIDEQGLGVVEIQGLLSKKVDVLASRLQAQGLSLEAQAASADLTAPRGLEPLFSGGLLPDEGLQALLHLLSGPTPPQMAVSTFSLGERVKQLQRLAQAQLQGPAGQRRAGPLHPRPSLATPYVAPRDEQEQRMAEIWQDLLGIAEIGIHDSFFDLGGDSILSIQLVSRANQAGFQIAPRDLFVAPNIAGLLELPPSRTEIAAEQGLVSGPLPLTPLQHYYFEGQPANPHHHNLLLLLEMLVPPDMDRLRQAAHQLTLQHDSLRSRFVQEHGVWRAWLAEPEPPEQLALDWIDLSALPEQELSSTIEEGIERLHRGLNISQGPLFRIAYFACGAQRPGRLLLLFHHLVIDALSAPTVTEDLMTAYFQLGQGQPVRLPPKTTSVKHWAERLAQYAQSPELRREADYWLGLPWERALPLPADHPGGRQTNTQELVGLVMAQLSAQETLTLERTAQLAYGNQVLDLIALALGQAFEPWLEGSPLLVELVGHGREAPFDDVDLSRTVNWFSNFTPVFLEPSLAERPEDALRRVKAQLQAIPNGGIGYGALRYLCQDPDLRQRFQALPCAEVMLNYVGQAARPAQLPEFLRPADESKGTEIDPRNRRRDVFWCQGGISEGQLYLRFGYSRSMYEPESVEALAQRFLAALRALIAHCQEREGRGVGRRT